MPNGTLKITLISLAVTLICVSLTGPAFFDLALIGF
jgi:hypothetical protein